MSAIWTATAADPVAPAKPINASLARTRPRVRPSNPSPESPNLPGSRVATAVTKAAALTTFARFQNAPPTLPRSGLQPTTATLESNAAFPKSVPPKQAARPRLWATRAAVESFVIRGPP